MWHWHGYGGFGVLGWLGMAVMMFLVLGGLVALVALGVWAVSRGSGSSPGRASVERRGEPLETLRVRYARGEITREEYQEMRRELES